jgi:hypothetical protein
MRRDEIAWQFCEGQSLEPYIARICKDENHGNLLESGSELILGCRPLRNVTLTLASSVWFRPVLSLVKKYALPPTETLGTTAGGDIRNQQG